MLSKLPFQQSRWAGSIALASAIGAATGAASADTGYGYGHHMMGWGGWIVGALMMAAGIATFVGIVYLVIRLVTGGSGTGKTGDRALALLREQYAKGEIDESEYDTRKRNLER